MATSEWIKKNVCGCVVCVWAWIENHKWKMSFVFGWDIFFSFAVIVVFTYYYLLFWCAVSEMCVVCRLLLFVSEYTLFNKLYKSTNQCFYFFFNENRKQKTETACMTPSDNIVYALCNFFVTYGMGYVSCASKTNIVRRWLNYVCLCWLCMCLC